MRVALAPAARRDLVAIVDHYASLWPQGLDAEFGRAMDDMLSLLAHSPLAFPLVRADVRRLVMRAPFRTYSIFYRVLSDHVRVVAVVHTRRHPRRYIRRR